MDANKYKFQKLTPVNNVDMTLYDDALNYIFDNADVRNVAISGAYGAGKSSVLATYKDKNKKLRFLHISLAHFEQPDKEGEVEVKEITLEGKILNQLIHQIPAEKIPQTNFKVKKKVATKGIAYNAVPALVFLLSILHIAFFTAWDTYVNSLSDSCIKTVLGVSRNPYSLILSGLLCIAITGVFIWAVVKAQKNKNVFRKISLQGNEIEIFEDTEESYFDKYLNEVLYLFENSDADVIVFEDMDRFNANRIFERLREINTLVNIQLSKETKPPLRFFYLLRDDIFVSKDRTKFFDYIVPVVPVVDSSNSYDQFIAHFKESGIFALFNESFLQGLSLYVDDMRILKNIYNEFVVYYNRLNITELNCNKMLAMITYKNIFPRDFSDLQLNRGFVYTLFSQKEQFIQNEIEKIKNQIANLNQKIEDAKNEHLHNIGEVDEVYKNRLENLRNQMRYNTQSKTQYDALIAEITIRKEAIANKETEKVDILNKQIFEYQQSMTYLYERKMSEIITRDNIDFIFSVKSINDIGVAIDFNEIKGNEYFALLKYLIRNGYIDVTYADYMTYFYENSLSRIDKMFLRSITDKKSKEFTYQLKKPLLVVERLNLIDFDQEEILNFDLLEYLLQTPIHKDFLDRFMRQLNETKNFKFILEYFETKRELPSYIKTLNSHWPGLFAHALDNGALTKTQLRQYSISTLYYSSDDVIQAVNIVGCLTQYISESSDYLNIAEPNIEKLIHGFKLMDVSFCNIDSKNLNWELLEQVYKNSQYQVNFDNIKIMLGSFYPAENENDIRHKNYTIVLSQPESPLADYLNKNIKSYFDVVLEISGGQITDAENVVLCVLNNEEIANEQKISYIEQLTTTITSLAEVINKDLWSTLLKNRVAAYSVENVIEYFGDSTTLDIALVDFINGEETPLDFSEMQDQYGKEKAKNLFGAIIICNNLSNRKYQEILTAFGYGYNEFAIDGISEEKMQIIFDANIVRMTKESLVFIREHYKSKCLYFIKKRIEKYAEIMTLDLFDLSELREILAWDVADELKISLLDFTKEQLSVTNTSYTPSVTAYILKNNLNPEDRPKLFASYDKWAADVKEVIVELAINKIADIIADSSHVSVTLLKILLGSLNLNQNEKIDLFTSSLSRLDKDDCNEIIDILELPEYKKLFEPRKRPSFEVSDTSKKMLTAFANENIIHSFEEDTDKPGYYKINRHKAVSKTLPSELL